MDLGAWAPPDRLARWVHDATDRLLGAVADFDDDDPRWTGPQRPTVNPPIWEIAHVAWFAESFVLRRLHGHAPLIDRADERYDSAAVAHEIRWTLDHPDPAATKDYVRRVGDALAGVVVDDRGLDSTSYFVAYAISHYDAHVEALTYTRQALEWGPQPGSGAVAAGVENDRAVDGGDRTVDGGERVLGASRRQPFIVDNERWGHRVDVAPFAMAAVPVTVTDFAAFVDDGGYDREASWSTAGWDWRRSTPVRHPAYWRGGRGEWECRLLDRWLPIEAIGDHPMVHVSWWEAEAYCTWAGRRLPTEAEWEVAATTGPAATDRRPWFPWGDREPEPHEANLDAATDGTAPVGAHAAGDGRWGHRQLIGNVWEWTSSTFEPYPHFEPDAYRDNSEPSFGSRKVLRGGSWATRSRYIRSTFRNYFEPDRRDVFAGFRTCAR